MEFLSEYYLWFIIGGIILVMAVIGYIADKTDFGRKNKITETNNKLKEENETKNSVTETSVGEVDNVALQENISTEATETTQSINEVVNELEVPNSETSDTSVKEQPIIEDIKNIQPEENDVEQPIMNDINDISNSFEVKEFENKEVIDDSAYVLNNDLSSFAAGANSENIVPVSNAVEEVVNDQDNDDDIWKF